MFVYLQSFFLVILEASCCKIFFETFGKKRYESGRLKNYILFTGWIASVYLAAMVTEDVFFFIKQGAVILLTGGFMALYLEIGCVKTFILAALFQGVLSAVDYCVLLFCISVFPHMLQLGESYEMESLFLAIIAKILLFMVVLMIQRYLGTDSDTDLTDTEWLRFLVFPVFTIGVIAAMITTSAGAGNREKDSVLSVIAFCLAGMNGVVFSLIKDILKREQELGRAEVFRVQAKNQTRMYRSISDNFEKQKKKTHEFKNQMVCIEALVTQQKYDELHRYIRNICGSLSSETPAVQTNHVIVDAILNSKYQEMKKKNIIFIFQMDDLSGILMQDEDIVVILSNLLNNAIEACGQCQEQKMVKMKLIKEKHAVILSVRNTYAHKILYQDGVFQTTKEHETGEHGIGLKNITDTIIKYGGYYTIENNEKEFYFSAVIPQ